MACSACQQESPVGARFSMHCAVPLPPIAETGARNLAAFLLVERAAFAALRGDVEGQTAHLRDALTAFTQMGATGRAREVASMLDGGTDRREASRDSD